MSTPDPHAASARPMLLIPGLACSPRLFAPQLPALWQFGPVSIANHTRHDRMEQLAQDILDHAPPRFVLAGLSMGGYLSFEILRQAPQRVLALAVLDSSARADTPEAKDNRRRTIAMAEQGKLALATELNFPRSVHPDFAEDAELKKQVHAMARDTGATAYIRQQTAIMHRPDSRPSLAAIHCPTLIVVGDSDQLTPPELAEEMANAIPGAQLERITRCGHLSTLEQPETVTGILVDWLRTLDV